MKRLIITILFSFLTVGLFAQKSEPVDSLVSLLSAKSMELIEKNGMNYRKVTGPARFLHNNTYLICDTALWNVNNEEIYAIGNVKILQNETVLTSDNLTYYIPRNVAEFRGSLVQLQDKERNTLRTRFLDYNTKDSVAIFQNGGALKDKDGQVIESLTGSYDAKIKTFRFSDNVNMFSDSIFVRTTVLEYQTDINKATFGYNTNAWKDDNMLSSNSGWYDRNKELFFFTQNVHAQNTDKEGWADSLYFNRNTRNLEMLGNVQLMDTVKNVTSLAGHLVYIDSLSKLVLSRDAAIIGVTDDKGKSIDSLYFGADTIVYRSIPKYRIDSTVVALSAKRLENLSVDAIMTYRQKAAAEAAKKAEEEAMKDPAKAAELKSKEANKAKSSRKGLDAGSEDIEEEPKGLSKDSIPDSDKHSSDSLVSSSDSLGVVSDSISVMKDSLASKVAPAVKDTAKVGFIWAYGNGKLYRDDVQILCDSLEYNDLDSLAIMYKRPVIWNEKGRHQYSADSLIAVIKNKRMEKADLMSEAFVIVQESDSVVFDQIRGAEMLAYFDSTSALRRFDVLGDASAVFYIKEDSTFSTVNKSQAKMLYAQFKNGDIESLSYYQDIKNDVYPLAQMSKDDRSLKGFTWAPEKRPKSKNDIVKVRLRTTERRDYSSRPGATFSQTDVYFPGYMKEVYKKMEEAKKAKEKREREEALKKSKSDSLKSVSDSLSAKVDSLSKAVADSVVTDSLSNAEKSNADSLGKKASDSASVAKPLSEKELEKQAKEAEKAARLAEKEAKWARLDSLDSLKQKKAELEKAAKLRAKKLKQLKKQQLREQRENEIRQRYIEYFRKKKAAMEKKKSRKNSQESKIPDKIKDVVNENVPEADKSAADSLEKIAPKILPQIPVQAPGSSEPDEVPEKK